MNTITTTGDALLTAFANALSTSSSPSSRT